MFRKTNTGCQKAMYDLPKADQRGWKSDKKNGLDTRKINCHREMGCIMINTMKGNDHGNDAGLWPRCSRGHARNDDNESRD